MQKGRSSQRRSYQSVRRTVIQCMCHRVNMTACYVQVGKNTISNEKGGLLTGISAISSPAIRTNCSTTTSRSSHDHSTSSRDHRPRLSPFSLLDNIGGILHIITKNCSEVIGDRFHIVAMNIHLTVAECLEAHIIGGACHILCEILEAEDSTIPCKAKRSIIRRGRGSRGAEFLTDVVEVDQTTVRDLITTVDGALANGSIGTNAIRLESAFASWYAPGLANEHD